MIVNITRITDLKMKVRALTQFCASGFGSIFSEDILCKGSRQCLHGTITNKEHSHLHTSVHIHIIIAFYTWLQYLIKGCRHQRGFGGLSCPPPPHLHTDFGTCITINYFAHTSTHNSLYPSPSLSKSCLCPCLYITGHVVWSSNRLCAYSEHSYQWHFKF